MSLEKKIKTGVVVGRLTVVMMTGGSYDESFSNEVPSDVGDDISSISRLEINTFTSTQTFGSNIDAFIDIDSSFRVESPETIIKDALNQIKNLNYIEVDDEIDRKIDAFFASRQSKKVKKIIYKRA